MWNINRAYLQPKNYFMKCLRTYIEQSRICPWCLASGLCSVLFSVPGIYVETYVYDDVYVRLSMTSYLRQKSHHVRQPYIGSSKSDFSFRHNFTKKCFFSKVRLIPDSARSDLSKEPIKSQYLCKNAKKIRNSVTTVPKCQVAYTFILKHQRTTCFETTF